MFVSCFDKVELFYDCDKGFSDKLYTCSPLLVWLNRCKRFKSAEFYENICKLFWQGRVIFLEVKLFVVTGY